MIHLNALQTLIRDKQVLIGRSWGACTRHHIILKHTGCVKFCFIEQYLGFIPSEVISSEPRCII